MSVGRTGRNGGVEGEVPADGPLVVGAEAFDDLGIVCDGGISGKQAADGGVFVGGELLEDLGVVYEGGVGCEVPAHDMVLVFCKLSYPLRFHSEVRMRCELYQLS